MAEFYSEHKKLINFIIALALLAVFALCFGCYAVFELYLNPKFFNNEPTPMKANTVMQNVVVAKRELQSGRGILENEIELKLMPESTAPSLALTKASEAIHHLPIRTISKGEIIRNHLLSEATTKKDYLKIGKRYFERRKYTRAIKQFDKALEIDPGYVKAYEWKGHALYKSGESKKSKECFQKAIELDPEASYSHGYLAFLLLNEKKYDDVVNHGKIATKLDPEDSQSFAYLGIALFRQEKPKEALVPLTAAIKLDPSYAYAQYYRGRAFLALNQLDKSLVDLDAAVENDKGYRERVLKLKGDVYLKKGDYEKALGLYNACLGLAKAKKSRHSDLSLEQAAECYFGKATCEYNLENYDNARKFIEVAIKHKEKPPKTYYDLQSKIKAKKNRR